jgi:formate--tetrahydrofolate ligase
MYGAADISADSSLRGHLDELDRAGFGQFPVCVAKTQYSFSVDPSVRGAPSGHVVPVRELRLAGGAEFVVAICGEIMTMPGLPRLPSAARIKLDADGNVQGLA